MNKLIISIILTIISLVVVLASPPTSIIGLSSVYAHTDFNNTFVEIDITNGNVTIESLIPTQDFLPFGILSHTSTNVLIVGNLLGHVCSLNYDINSNEITVANVIKNTVDYRANFQNFGYDAKNNIAYDVGYDEISNAMALFIFNFNTGLGTNITFNFPHDLNYMPSAYFDAPNNLYYIMYQDPTYTTLTFTYNMVTGVTSTPINVGVTGLYLYPFVYNSMFFCGAVNGFLTTLYAIDIASGTSKSLVEQTAIFYNLQFSPFVFDPRGYAVLLTPLQQENYIVNATTFSFDSMSVVENIKFENNIPLNTFIMNTLN